MRSVALLQLVLVPLGAGWEPVRSGRITLITLNPLRPTASMANDSTGWPGTIEEGRRVYEANWRCYAKLHGYRLHIERNDQSARHLFPPSAVGLTGDELARWSEAGRRVSKPELLRLPPPYSPYWVKPVLVERYLPTSPWVLYFDSDAIFLALPSRLEDVLQRVTTSATDVVVITNTLEIKMTVKARMCACIFAVRSSPGGWWFVRRWAALRTRDNLFGDMGAFSHAVVEMHLRHAAALSAARAAASAGTPPPPSWHSTAYDGVASPCLHAHWSLADRNEDYRCMGAVMSALLTKYGTLDSARAHTAELPALVGPVVDHPTGWPVAWSTELAANVQRRQMGLVGFGGDKFVPSRNNYGARLAHVRAIILRRNSREYRPNSTPPTLLAHHKTGKHYILLSLYHETAIDRIARVCSRRIRCVHPTAFVNRSLFAPGAREWELPSGDGVEPSTCRARAPPL